MQPATQAYQSLQDFTKTRKSTSDILNEANTKYGVDELTGRAKQYGSLVGNLQNSINAVDPSVTGRTSGSLVTEAQRSALVNREQQPLLRDLGTASQNYSTAQNDLGTARGQAGTYASTVQGDLDSRYKALTDAYSASVAAEAEQQRRAEADRAFAEQQRQFNAQQAAARAASSGYRLGGGSGGVTSTPAPATDPVQQDAYNDVRSRIAGDSNSIMSDYRATLDSANRGNVRDKLKIQLYHQLRPDLFGGAVPATAVMSNNVSY